MTGDFLRDENVRMVITRSDDRWRRYLVIATCHFGDGYDHLNPILVMSIARFMHSQSFTGELVDIKSQTYASWCKYPVTLLARAILYQLISLLASIMQLCALD